MAARLLAPPIAPSTRPRSERKLSEVTKKLAIPRGITTTGWPRIADVCSERMGIEFDGWQSGMGSLLLAKPTPNAMLAHTVGGFHLSAMRQVGKTYFFAGALFGLCVEYPGLLVIWSAHHSKTHNETFQSMQAFAERRQIKPFIEQVYTGSGDEEVRFHNGSRILFGARERGFGRGVPGVDVLVTDEGQILSEKAMQNMLATLNTSWLGLHIYAGTPPLAEEMHKAESWMRARGEAWIGGKDAPMQIETEDMVWIEIGADDGCDLDDREQWYKNPSFPHRTPLEAFMRLRRKLNDDGFRREGLGLYDEDDASVFDIEGWNKRAVDDADPPARGSLVLDVSPDARWTSIGIAGDLAVSSDVDDERALVMVISIRGTAGAVAKIVEMNDAGKLDDIAITSGAARALETDLTKAGLEYDTLTQSDMSAAYGNLQKAIKEGTVAHLDQPELNFALINAKSRFLQTGEAQAFDRREYSVDVSPAVAIAGALYRFGMGDGMPYIG